jgi:hypothetical protein
VEAISATGDPIAVALQNEPGLPWTFTMGHIARIKKPTEPEQQYRWQIYHIRGTPAQYLGMVEAPDAAGAIRKAITELKVPPQQRKRLIAVRYK